MTNTTELELVNKTNNHSHKTQKDENDENTQQNEISNKKNSVAPPSTSKVKLRADADINSKTHYTNKMYQLFQEN